MNINFNKHEMWKFTMPQCSVFQYVLHTQKRPRTPAPRRWNASCARPVGPLGPVGPVPALAPCRWTWQSNAPSKAVPSTSPWSPKPPLRGFPYTVIGVKSREVTWNLLELGITWNHLGITWNDFDDFGGSLGGFLICVLALGAWWLNWAKSIPISPENFHVSGPISKFWCILDHIRTYLGQGYQR